MFVTQAHFQQHVPRGLAMLDSHYWRIVGLTLQTPWYLCTYRTASEPHTRTILVAWESDLLDLMTAVDSQRLMAIARLDSPSTNPYRWSMRWVKVIWLAAGDEREEAGPLVFQLDDDDVPRDDMLRPLPSRTDRVQIFSSGQTP